MIKILSEETTVIDSANSGILHPCSGTEGIQYNLLDKSALSSTVVIVIKLRLARQSIGRTSRTEIQHRT